jgi:hypothetical protein
MRHHPASSSEPGARDAALRKLRILNRCLIAGSVTLTGVLTDVAAHAFPGRTIRTADTRHRTPRAGQRAASPRRTANPLRAPAQPPQAVNTPPSTTASTPAEAAPPAETTPTQETTPTPEPAREPAPVVSGGS